MHRDIWDIGDLCSTLFAELTNNLMKQSVSVCVCCHWSTAYSASTSPYTVLRTSVSILMIIGRADYWRRLSAFWRICLFLKIRRPIRDQFQTGLFWLWCSRTSLSVVSTLSPALSHPRHHLIGYTQSQVTANQQWELCTHTAHTRQRGATVLAKGEVKE